MSDFMSVQPIAGTGNAVRPAPPEPQPQVKATSESDDTGASKDFTNEQGASAQAAKAREFAKAKALDENILTGPPPSFQASLLEVEGQLDNIIKRMEAARERAKTAESGATAPRANQVSDDLPEQRPAASTRDDSTSPTTDDLANNIRGADVPKTPSDEEGSVNA